MASREPASRLCGLMFCNAVMLHDDRALGEKSQDLGLFMLLDDIYRIAAETLIAAIPPASEVGAANSYRNYVSGLFG